MRLIKGVGKINDFFAFLSSREARNPYIRLALGDSLQHPFEFVLLNTVIKARLFSNFIPKINAYS
jgi:hypothetical protein